MLLVAEFPSGDRLAAPVYGGTFEDVHRVWLRLRALERLEAGDITWHVDPDAKRVPGDGGK